MRNAIKVLFVLVASGLICTGVRGANDTQEIEVEGELDGIVVEAIATAAKDFKTRGQSFKCFVVGFTLESETVIRVDFIPKTDIPKPDAESIRLGGRTNCGQGVSYRVTDGKIVKRWLAR